MTVSLEHLPSNFVNAFKEIVLKLTTRQPEARLSLSETINQLYALESQILNKESDLDAAYAEGRALAQSFFHSVFIDWLELADQISQRLNYFTERFRAPQSDALAMAFLKGLPINAFSKKVSCIDDAKKVLKCITSIYPNLSIMGQLLEKLNSPAYQFLDKDKARFYADKIRHLLQKGIRADYDFDRIMKLSRKIHFLYKSVTTFVNQSLAEKLRKDAPTKPQTDAHGFFKAPGVISKSKSVQAKASLRRKNG